VIFNRFEGQFSVHPKVRLIALNVPGNVETYRQVLRVGADRNDCLVASDDSEQLLRAARIATYLHHKEYKLGRPRNDFQRTVVPAGRFSDAQML
jgi:hypothetical protein